jgi:hypothetical protein
MTAGVHVIAVVRFSGPEFWGDEALVSGIKGIWLTVD